MIERRGSFSSNSNTTVDPICDRINGTVVLAASVSCSRTITSNGSLRPLISDTCRSVDSHFAALHDDIARCLHVDLSATLDRDVLSLDGDRPILLHRDTGAAGLDRHRVSSINDKVLADLVRVVLADA